MFTVNGKHYKNKPVIINTGDQQVTINLDNVPSKIIREVNFSIKAYPRPNRETQQIYINGVYFMSFPSRVETEDPDNILGSQAIELITYLYERGLNLNDIKTQLDKIVNKNIKRRLINPRLKALKKQRETEREIQRLTNLINKNKKWLNDIT